MAYVVFTNFPECHCRLDTELLNVCKVALQCLSVTLHVLRVLHKSVETSQLVAWLTRHRSFHALTHLTAIFPGLPG